VNVAYSMAVRCLIDVRAGVEWVRAMAAWGLITTLVVVWGLKAVLISVCISQMESDLTLTGLIFLTRKHW